MILYNSILAKTFLRQKKYYFMFFGCCFTRYKYLAVSSDTILRLIGKLWSIVVIRFI